MRAAAAQIEIKEEDWSYRYEGQVQGEEWHGQGVLSRANGYGSGYRYEGGFRNTEYHGHGTMTYPDDRVESGQWEDNKFLG